MSSLDAITLMGLAAGLLHFVGYVAYVSDADIEPNPVTWLMFAYGTLLLTFLEWDSDATFGELLLPTVCSAMAVYVAGRCWQRARRRNPSRYWPREWWPSDWRDRAAFQFDLVLTALYLTAFLLQHNNWIGAQAKEFAVIAFLVAANLTTFSAFFPLIRSVLENPNHERTTPWAIWACAYALLGLTTIAAQGTVWTVLMIYPAQNAILHGAVAYLSRKTRRDHQRRTLRERGQHDGRAHLDAAARGGGAPPNGRSRRRHAPVSSARGASCRRDRPSDQSGS